MDEIPKRIVVTTVEEIYRGKERRRKLMAALPFEEKIKIVEELQEFAKATAPHRAEHRRKMEEARRQASLLKVS